MNSRLPRFAPILASLSLAALAACVPRVEPPPPPPPAPAPAPTPAPAPPAPIYENWMDAPQTPGDWSYQSGAPYSYALFGADQTQIAFLMRCDRANRTVSLVRASGQAMAQPISEPMQVATETATRLLSASPREELGRMALAADLPATDSLLDAMALSKGRFAVQTGGEATLYLPSWPEVTRVIEDCR